MTYASIDENTSIESRVNMVTQTALGADLVVTIAGSVRIQEADGFADALKEALAAPSPLVILDLEQAENVDLTFFQILLAFQKSLINQHRSLLLRNLVAGHPVDETAELLGLELKRHFTLETQS